MKWEEFRVSANVEVLPAKSMVEEFCSTLLPMPEPVTTIDWSATVTMALAFYIISWTVVVIYNEVKKNASKNKTRVRGPKIRPLAF